MRRRRDNDFCFDYLPRITGDHGPTRRRSTWPTARSPGYIVVGREPRRRLGQRPPAARRAVRGRSGSSCATSSRSRRRRSGTSAPEIESGELRTEDIGTEVFFLPAAAHTEKDGLVHEHPAPAAVAPQGGRAGGRLPLRPVVLLPPRPDRAREARRAGRGPTTATGRCSTSPGTTRPSGAHRRALRRGGAARDQRLGRRRQAALGLHRAEGRRLDDVRLLDLLRLLRRRDEPGGAAQEPARAEPGWRRSGAGPGRRTGASSTTAPRPTPTASPGRSASATSGGTPRQERWTGEDVPDFEPDKRPDYVPPDGRPRGGRDRRHAAVHHAVRRPRLAVRPGRARRRAAADALRAARVAVRERALRAAREPGAAAASTIRATRTTRAAASPARRPTRSCSRPTG